MNRKDYRTTPDFLKSLDIVKSFVSDALNGDVSMLKDENITLLINRISDRKKRNLYFGSIADPDMYYITQAIYILIWGHVFDLTFEKLGSWGRVKHPFRGDTMNSFNSVFGKEYLIAKRYNVNKNLLKNIEEYLSLYHSIGNFIVIPNKLNLNRQRANYYTLQDYFDSFLGALFQYKYQDIETEYRIFSEELHSSFTENTIFNKIEFKKYISFWKAMWKMGNRTMFLIYLLKFEEKSILAEIGVLALTLLLEKNISIWYLNTIINQRR